MKKLKYSINLPLAILIAVWGSAFCHCKAQTFQRTYGGPMSDAANWAQQTSDGGFIVAGETPENGPGYQNIFLIKTNSSGDTIWTKVLGITTMSLRAKYIQQTADSGFILVGGIGIFSPTDDMLLIKTNSSGEVSWSKTYGGTGFDMGNAVQQTDDGGYILTGLHTAVNGETGLIKADGNGNIEWSKTFGGPVYYDVATTVKQTSDGGFIVAGTHSLPPVTNIMLTKTDSSGTVLWTKIIGGTLQRRCDFILETTDGGYVLLGKIYDISVSTSHDIYLVRTNAAGDTLWTRTYGGSSHNEEGFSVQETGDGGFIIGGNTRSFGAGMADAYIIKTDSTGQVVWSKAYGGGVYDFAFSVQQTSDGGYIASGNTSSYGAGISDAYLIKTDANGNSGCSETSAATVTSVPQAQVSSVTLSLFSGITATNIVVTAGHGTAPGIVCLASGINEKTPVDPFIIYPNPSPGPFIIEMPHPVSGTIGLYNTLGQALFMENVNNEYRREINLQSLPAGIYLVKVFDGGSEYCKKIIVDHD